MTTKPLDAAAPDWDAIARFLAGEAAGDEAAAVRAWLDAHPGDAALVRALDGALGRLAVATAEDVDVDDAFRRVSARRDAPVALRLEKSGAAPSRVQRPWRASMWRAAAAIAVVATGALSWTALRNRGSSAAAGEQTYATAVGQRDSVRLPDGSRIVLGPASRLVVAAGYGKSTRDVTLVGEGYFDVRHDDAHTFTVRAGDATIRDVGTTFTVRTGGPTTGVAAGVRVAVHSGAVLLDAADGAPDRGVVLHQGDVGELVAGGRPVARPGAATGDDAAWTRGRLVLREAALDEVRAELARWYGVQLRVTDSAIARRHLSTEWRAEDSADRVLQVVGLALGAHVERRGDTAFVTAPGGR